MFLDRLNQLNPEFARTAVRLHQAGAVRANTYLLDVDAFRQNSRTLQAAAASADLKIYAMTKQFGRNPDACAAIVEGGVDTAVAVDIQCMEAVLRGPLRVGHVGHLVQPHRGTEDAVIAAEPEVVTVFADEIAERIGAAAVRAGRTQAVLLRVVGSGDFFYFGHGGGFQLDTIETAAGKIDRMPGVHVTGVTTFPCLLADPVARTVAPTANFTTLRLAADRLRAAGFDIEQVNAPGTTSARTMALLSAGGATHVEPGNAFHGTTPTHVLDGSAPEIPAIVYVSEISHFEGNDAYVFGAGFYIDRVLGNYQLRAMCGRDESAIERVVDAEIIPDGAISYYCKLHLSPDHGLRVGDTAVFCFRPQTFVTRGRTQAVFGIAGATPSVGHVYDNEARMVSGVS